MDDPIAQLEADCAERDLKVSAVLREARVSPSTYWRWRNDGLEPRAGTVRKLRSAFERLTAQDAA